MRNFRLAYIKGSSNVKTSSFREHAENDMHKHAVKFHGKSQSTATINNTPIVQSFAGSLMNKATLERTKKSLILHILLLKKA